jgi:integrase
VGWLCDPDKQDGRKLADSSVRKIVAPPRVCLASAVREGLIRVNPAREVNLRHRPVADPDQEDTRALMRDQLDAFLAAVPDQWRTFFALLSTTGLRISEAVGLRWRHVELEGAAPMIKVGRRIVFGTVGPPKSRYGRRDIPIPPSLVKALRKHRVDTEWPRENDPVFTTSVGTALLPRNVFARVLKPAAETAGVPWAGFHTFRHTCASMLFAEGRNAVQVQRWLGHHSPAFTLSVYVHLLDEDLGGALELPTPKSANKVQTRATPTRTKSPSAKTLEGAD